MVFRSASCFPNYLNYSIKRRVLARSPSANSKLFASKIRRKRRPMPEWDSTIHDLSVFKLTAAQQAAKRTLHESRDYGASKHGVEASRRLGFETSGSSTSSDSEHNSEQSQGVGGKDTDSEDRGDTSEETEECDVRSDAESSEGSGHEQDLESLRESDSKQASESDLEASPRQRDDFGRGRAGRVKKVTRDDSKAHAGDTDANSEAQSGRGQRIEKKKIADCHETAGQIFQPDHKKLKGMAFPSLEDIRASCCSSPTVDFEDEVKLFVALQKANIVTHPKKHVKRGKLGTRKEVLHSKNSERTGRKQASCDSQKLASTSTNVMGSQAATRQKRGCIRNPVFRTGLVTYKSSGQSSDTKVKYRRRRRGVTTTHVNTQSIKRVQLLDPELSKQCLSLAEDHSSHTPGDSQELKPSGTRSRYIGSLEMTSTNGRRSQIEDSCAKSALQDSPFHNLHQEFEQFRHHHDDLLNDFKDFKSSTRQEIERLQTELQHMVSIQKSLTSNTSESPFDVLSAACTEQCDQTKDALKMPSQLFSGNATAEATPSCSRQGYCSPESSLSMQRHDCSTGASHVPFAKTDDPAKADLQSSRESLPQGIRDDKSQPREVPDFLRRHFVHLRGSPARDLPFVCLGKQDRLSLPTPPGQDARTSISISNNPLFSPLRKHDPSEIISDKPSKAGHEQHRGYVRRPAVHVDTQQSGSCALDASWAHSQDVDKIVSAVAKRLAAHEAEFQLVRNGGHQVDGRESVFANPFENPLYEGGLGKHLMEKRLSCLTLAGGASSLDKVSQVFASCRKEGSCMEASRMIAKSREQASHLKFSSVIQRGTNSAAKRTLSLSQNLNFGRGGRTARKTGEVSNRQDPVVWKYNPRGSAATFPHPTGSGLVKYRTDPPGLEQNVDKENMNYFPRKTFHGAPTWTSAKASRWRS